jgi:hypothetical protein
VYLFWRIFLTALSIIFYLLFEIIEQKKSLTPPNNGVMKKVLENKKANFLGWLIDCFLGYTTLKHSSLLLGRFFK